MTYTNNTNTAPQTYAAAAANAEQITIEELVALITEFDSPDIFPAPRRKAHLAISSDISTYVLPNGAVRGLVTYNRFARNGNVTEEFVGVGHPLDGPVFHFTNSGRTVQVAD